MSSSIPGLFPPGVSSTFPLPPPIVQSKMSPDISKCSLRKEKSSPQPPFENCCFGWTWKGILLRGSVYGTQSSESPETLQQMTMARHRARPSQSLGGKTQASMALKGPRVILVYTQCWERENFEKRDYFMTSIKGLRRRTRTLEHRHFINNGSQKGKTKKDKWPA